MLSDARVDSSRSSGLEMKSIHEVTAEQPNLLMMKSPPIITRNVETPKATSERFTSFDPPLQHLMKLGIHSPVSSQMRSSAVPKIIQKTPTFLRPKPKQHHSLAPAQSTQMNSTSDALHPSFKPSPELFLENDIDMQRTPSRSNADTPHMSGFRTERSSSSDHKEGSPFKMFCPIVHNAADLAKSTDDTEGKASYTHLPRLMPLKLVPQNEVRSKPFDPSIIGSHIKKSPLIKSLDMSPYSDDGLEDPEVKYYASINPDNLNRTPRQTNRETKPLIKLTPRTTPCKRNLDQGEVQPFMTDIELCPSTIKLIPRSQRKVSIDESNISPMEWNTPPPLLHLPSSIKDETCLIGTNLQFDNIDSRQQYTVQKIKHFLHTPKLKQKRSHSFLDTTSGSYDPLQSILRADAMIEAARANEPLTDDEDSDIECDADYVLCCPSSFGNRESKAPRMSIGCAGSNNAKPTVSAANHFEMFPSLLGTISSKDSSLHKHGSSANTLETAPVAVDTDCFKTTRSDAGDCSLVLSSDSSRVDAERDLSTPPPIFDEGNGFHTLSPPLLCPKQAGV